MPLGGRLAGKETGKRSIDISKVSAFDQLFELLNKAKHLSSFIFDLYVIINYDKNYCRVYFRYNFYPCCY